MKFMIASGFLGQFQSVDSVAMGKEKGEEIQQDHKDPTKVNQDTVSAGEIGRTTQWPGARWRNWRD